MILKFLPNKRASWPLLCLVCLALCACDDSSRTPHSKSAESAIKSIRGLQPWFASKPYSPKEWENVLTVAAALQELNPEDLYAVYASFSDETKFSCEESSKLFLLLRIMFVFPTTSVGAWQRGIYGWGGDVARTNAEGKFNLSWPVNERKDGQLELSTMARFYSGFSYNPTNDLEYVRNTYPLRKPIR